MANYKFSVKAEQDIAEIYEYGILNFGRNLASDYMVGLQKNSSLFQKIHI